MYLGCASVTLQESKYHSCSQQVMLGGLRSSQAQRTRVLILKKLLINSENSLFNQKHTRPVGPPLQVHLCEPIGGLQPGMDLYNVGLEGCVARQAPKMVCTVPRTGLKSHREFRNRGENIWEKATERTTEYQYSARGQIW